MPEIEHTGIWGRSKSGKSTVAKGLARQRSRLVVFDLLDEYVREAPVKVSSRIDLARAILKRWREGFRVRYVPPRGADLAGELEGVVSLLMEAQAPRQERGVPLPDITLLVEEMAASFPNVRRNSAMVDACNRGRHFGIELIGVSQRLADVSPAFRGNCARDFYLPMNDETDYKAAANRLRPFGRQYVDRLRTLKPHEWLCRTVDGVTEGKNK